MAGNDMRYVWSLRATAATEVAQAGGKGAVLARLLQAGLPVPPGCVLGPEALTAFLAAQSLTVMDSPDTILSALRTASVPDTLQTALHQALSALEPAAYGWAVRSSAVTEDSRTASFAGMYDSVLSLDVDALWSGIRACWASWWSERAVAYRQYVGETSNVPAMAIIVQHMVDAHSAGVAFTAEPMHADRSRMVINAAPGLGTAVVSGVVEPEQYTLEKRPQVRLLEARLLQPDGVPLLAPDVVGTLGTLLVRLETLCDSPQDVEWAWDGKQCWILQSRPITTFTGPEAGEKPDVWGNSNLKDVIPGLVSPFTWSLMRPQLEAALRAQYAQLQYNFAPERPLIRRFWGRAYFNLSQLYEAAAVLFAATPEDQAAQLGGATIPDPPAPLRPTLRQRLSWLWSGLRFLELVERCRTQAPKHLAAAQQQWQEELHRVPHLNSTALLEKIATYEQTSHDLLLLHLTLTWAMSASFGYVQKFVAAALPQADAGVAAELMTGLGDISSAEQSYHLWELSRLARQSPQVMAFLRQKDWHDWRQALAETSFLQAWQAFLAVFGHRAVYEIEMANPRWREEPDYLFEVLVSYADMPRDQAPFDPVEQARRRQAARRYVLQHLSIWQRPWFRFVLRRAQAFSRLRENSKSHLVQRIDIARLMALQAGQFLVQAGILKAVADIFFLEAQEIIAALQGDLPADIAQRRVLQRYQARQRDAARQPPDLIVGERPVYHHVLHMSSSQLTGLPSSPGRVTGIARILRSPQEGVRLQPGDILVAPSTDPGWTPLFLLAAGLVMETGGYLSHGAIVAREYGIPAVLNIPLVTQRIPDGSTITVDGGQGIVQLLGPQARRL